jgi:DNA topoisomerase-1
MSKNLVIVESPAKSKTISKYLGKDYTVKATMGHVRDLPEKELGVDIENGFAPKYITSKGKRRILKALKDEAAKAEIIYLAPDPDREGEAIAWHVEELISEVNPNIKRVMFNEITKRAVLAAIENAHTIDMNKVNAQQARRILDRVVGYQISPILWRTVFRGLSAGRVQSVALRLICEREDAISIFKQEEFWSLQAPLRDADNNSFLAKLHRIDDQKAELHNESETDALIASLQGQSYDITNVQRTEKVRKPYPPFITSTLQQEAARKLGFSAAKTMVVAQQLYEGLELGELGSTGLITYMRTDSTRIANEAIEDARAIILQQYDERHLPEKPRTYGKSKNAQDAHEAIRPSQVSVDFSPDKVKNFLSKDQLRLYTLIWRRFFASQMENALFDSTRVDITAANCMFRATGSIMRFEGFLVLYDESRDEPTENSEGANERLPDLQTGMKLSNDALIKKQHFTQPPVRYTEALLVRELEDKGIGRPSTYAQIIDTLKRREYVLLEKRRFVPTEVGYMVKNILVREFPDIFNVQFTAGMESELDKIEEGQAEWVKVLEDFYRPFSSHLGEVTSKIKEIRAENQEITEKPCPDCGQHNLVVKWSKNGKFLACQGFPQCKYTEPLEKIKTVESGEKCDKCGATMVILTINNNRFLGCSRYPECKNTKSLSTGVRCPTDDCDGVIVERRTKRGKLFYGCSGYPKCTFASWDEPVEQKCEKCGYPVLFRRSTKRRGEYLRCIKCRSEFNLEEEAPEQHVEHS